MYQLAPKMKLLTIFFFGITYIIQDMNVYHWFAHWFLFGKDGGITGKFLGGGKVTFPDFFPA